MAMSWIPYPTLPYPTLPYPTIILQGSRLLLVQVRLGCNSELILDEFGEKLLEELDYQQEARNIQVSTLTYGCKLGVR